MVFSIRSGVPVLRIKPAQYDERIGNWPSLLTLLLPKLNEKRIEYAGNCLPLAEGKYSVIFCATIA